MLTENFVVMIENEPTRPYRIYSAGALAIFVGMIALSVSAWLVRQIRGWVPAAFILSTFLGIVGTLVQTTA